MAFKPTQFQLQAIQDESATEDSRVLKLDEAVASTVQEFVPSTIRAPGQGSYAATRAKAGPLAATDTGRLAKSTKDARFSLNALLRGPLAIEEEERRAIEAQVQERTAALAEQVRQDAEERGFAEGLQQGREQAMAEVRAEARGRIERFDQLLGAFENARAAIFQANERFLLELIFRVARQVLLQELKADREYVLRLARQLLEKVGSREQIRIKISAQDRDAISAFKGGLEETFGALQGLKVEVSPEVELGGCLVETQWSAIDATVETQLRNILASLTRSE